MLRFTLAALLLAAGAVHAQPAPAVLSPNDRSYRANGPGSSDFRSPLDSAA